jgi:uncharacterized protein YwgA
MKRLQQAAVLVELADQMREHGSWSGETHIQKSTYFLQTLFDSELQFEFILYRHGPFSFDLRDELMSLRADGLFQLEPQAYPYGPRLRPTQAGVELKETYPRTLQRRRAPIAFIAERLGPKDVNQLERIATALYVTQEEPQTSPETRASGISALKPHITQERAVEAIEELDQLIAEARLLPDV